MTTTTNILETTKAQGTALGMTESAAEKIANICFGRNISSICVGYAGSFLFGGNQIKVAVYYSKEICTNVVERWNVEMVFSFKTGTFIRANKPTGRQIFRKERDNFASYLQNEEVFNWVKN